MDKLSYNISSIKKVKVPKDVQSSLFGVDFSLVARGVCPKSLTKLYWNREHTLIYCKKRGCSFALPSATYNDIISGKRLQEWKQFNNLMKR